MRFLIKNYLFIRFIFFLFLSLITFFLSHSLTTNAVAHESNNTIKETKPAITNTNSNSHNNLKKTTKLDSDGRIGGNKTGSDEHSYSVLEYAQIITSFAALGALIFLLWQNILLQKQTKSLIQSVRSATYQSVISFYVDINKSLVSDSNIAESFESFSDEKEDSNKINERRRFWLAFWLLNLYENSYIQYSLNSSENTYSNFSQNFLI